MGRRKIEIQPILHERNRSVTFLKRKNGLFKKAYELGVLCSVDVAVIIFEERPGHHVKCYEYCSGDVQAIVDRHNRFDGERDTRTPLDFGNNKMEEAGDDDDADEDDDLTRGNGAGKRRESLKSKTDVKKQGAQLRSNDLMNVDVDYRPMTIPTAPLQHLQLASSAPTGPNSSSLPISGERHNHQPPNKKPRLAPTPLQGEDRHHALSSPGTAINSHTPTNPFPYDDSYRLPYSVPPHSHTHPPQNHGPSFPAMFPTSTPPPPATPFFDFPRPSRTQSYPTNAYGQPPQQQRHSLHHGHDGNPGPLAFLDAATASGQGHRTSGPGQAQQYGAFDWPVHQQQQHQQHQNTGQAAHNPHDNSWLDLFATTGPPAESAPGPPALHLPPYAQGQGHAQPPAASHSHSSASSNDSRRASVSWERQQQHDVAASTAGGSATPVGPPGSAGGAGQPGNSGASSAVVSPALSHKRPRVDSSASGSVTEIGPASGSGANEGEGGGGGQGEGDGPEGGRASMNGRVKLEGDGGDDHQVPTE